MFCVGVLYAVNVRQACTRGSKRLIISRTTNASLTINVCPLPAVCLAGAHGGSRRTGGEPAAQGEGGAGSAERGDPAA